MKTVVNIWIRLKKYFNSKRLKLILSKSSIVVWFLTVIYDFYITHVSITEENYNYVFIKMVDILQFGLIGNFIILIFLHTYKYCWSAKVPIVGLIVLNFINLYFTSGEESEEAFAFYGDCFTYAIMISTSVMTVIFLIREKKKS